MSLTVQVKNVTRMVSCSIILYKNVFLNYFYFLAVLRVPMFDIEDNTIVKIELDYDNTFSGLNLHVGNSPTNELNGM